jgi:hypothetical protein
MGRVTAAVRVFFKTLFDGPTAERVAALLRGEPALPAPSAGPASAPAPAPQVITPPAKPQVSDAVLLLAALQREARLVDFLQEDLTAYADDQIGAAVREIHRDAGKVLARLFALQPIAAGEDGSAIDVPAGFDAGRFRLTGKVTGAPPFRGTLRHHGWEVTQLKLPTFTGSEDAARTIAPAEVEVQS